jgi:A/G-specific adenine glycosylase
MRHKLYTWYQANKRSLPWRENTKPYDVLVSELMLQQTQVKTVIPKYLNFIKMFPDVKSLSEADLDDVLKAWEGLGYYQRARNLKSCCEYVYNQLEQTFPSTANELKTLKGIGDYTAAAVASICFGENVPVMDGNVIRVISRLFCLDKDPRKSVKEMARFKQLASEHFLGIYNSGEINQGLMELGALVCTPKIPSCEKCPIQSDCKACKTNTVQSYPVVVKKKRQKKVHLSVLLICNADKLVLVDNTWRGYQKGYKMAPWLESEKEMFVEEFKQQISKSWQIHIQSDIKLVGSFNHNITHHSIKCMVFAGDLSGTALEKTNLTTLLKKSLAVYEKAKA